MTGAPSGKVSSPVQECHSFVTWYSRLGGSQTTEGGRISVRRGDSRGPRPLVDSVDRAISERRLLGVADPGLYFPFAIRIPDPARQGHHAIVGENISIKGVESRIVDVGNQHAFSQVVEDDDPGTRPEAPKRFLMEFGPDARTRTPHQQTNAFAAVSQGQHEQPGPPVLARLRVADQRAAAVIDLGFFPGLGEDDPGRLGRLAASKLVYETL